MAFPNQSSLASPVIHRDTELWLPANAAQSRWQTRAGSQAGMRGNPAELFMPRTGVHAPARHRIHMHPYRRQWPALTHHCISICVVASYLTHRIPKIPRAVRAPGESQAPDALGRRWDGSWPPVRGRLGSTPEAKLVARGCSILVKSLGTLCLPGLDLRTLLPLW